MPPCGGIEGERHKRTGADDAATVSPVSGSALSARDFLPAGSPDPGGLSALA